MVNCGALLLHLDYSSTGRNVTKTWNPYLNPFVSVVMPVYNGSRFVRVAIESVLAQTFAEFEIIVVDDASSDDSYSIVAAIRDPRIRLVRNEKNLGSYPSSNLGIGMARGRYVTRHDADDISLPSRFERQVSLLEDDPHVVLVSSEYWKIDESGQMQRRISSLRRSGHHHAVPWHLLFYNHLGAHSQVMMRRDDLVAVGGYPTEARYSQDYRLWVQMAQRGKVVTLPDVLLYYRSHPNSISGTHKERQNEHAWRVSSDYLSSFMGREVAVSDARDLKRFYVGNVSPSDDRFEWIENFVQEAFDVFVSGQTVSQLALGEIRRRVGSRFAAWSWNLCKRGKFAEAWRAIACAWHWSPRAIPSELWLQALSEARAGAKALWRRS